MDERAIVALQIGRKPRGAVSIAARCEYGLPMVARTSPVLENGEPFPTLYWLTCPLAAKAVGGIESSGTMREYNARLRSEPSLPSRTTTRTKGTGAIATATCPGVTSPREGC